MYKLILFLGMCSSFAAGSKPPEKLPAKHPVTLPVPDNKCQKIVGCYYTNNYELISDGMLNIEKMDLSLCTHLFYSSVELKKDGSVQLIDEGGDHLDIKGFQRINNLRKKNRRLKTLIAMEEAFVSEDVENKIFFDPTLREKLVDNVVNFVQKYKFNGIELDSLYLTYNNTVGSDKQNFVLLLKALKDKFDKKGLILSLVVDFRESTAKKYDIKEISKYVTFINLRAYDFHGGIYGDNKKIVKAGHIAPLYRSSKENTEDRKLNVDYIVKYWLSEGAPPSKLILGTTLRGLSYTLANPKQVGRDAPVVEDGYYLLPTIPYHEICPNEKNRVWRQLYDKEQQVRYIYNGKDMIAYDGVDSIKTKAEYAKKMELGGVLLDSLDDDDFSGNCGGEKYPLLRTVNRVLRGKC